MKWSDLQAAPDLQQSPNSSPRSLVMASQRQSSATTDHATALKSSNSSEFRKRVGFHPHHHKSALPTEQRPRRKDCPDSEAHPGQGKSCKHRLLPRSAGVQEHSSGQPPITCPAPDEPTTMFHTPSRHLQPQVVPQKAVQDRRKSCQHRQQENFNRGTKPLSHLPDGTPIRLHQGDGSWRPATVTQHAHTHTGATTSRQEMDRL